MLVLLKKVMRSAIVFRPPFLWPSQFYARHCPYFPSPSTYKRRKIIVITWVVSNKWLKTKHSVAHLNTFATRQVAIPLFGSWINGKARRKKLTLNPILKVDVRRWRIHRAMKALKSFSANNRAPSFYVLIHVSAHYFTHTAYYYVEWDVSFRMNPGGCIWARGTEGPYSREGTSLLRNLLNRITRSTLPPPPSMSSPRKGAGIRETRGRQDP